MPVEIDRPGDFRASVQEYGLFNAESGSVAVNMKFNILEWYNTETGEWDDWREYDFGVSGSFWIIKKPKEGQTRGDLNDRQIDALVKHCGWNAQLRGISEGTWEPTDCRVSVQKDDYQSKKLGCDVFKASFINAFDSTPGGSMGNVSAEEVGALDAQWGSKLRALASNAKATQKPAGKPAPPTKKAPPKQAPVDSEGTEAPLDAIPF